MQRPYNTIFAIIRPHMACEESAVLRLAFAADHTPRKVGLYQGIYCLVSFTLNGLLFGVSLQILTLYDF